MGDTCNCKYFSLKHLKNIKSLKAFKTLEGVAKKGNWCGGSSH